MNTDTITELEIKTDNLHVHSHKIYNQDIPLALFCLLVAIIVLQHNYKHPTVHINTRFTPPITQCTQFLTLLSMDYSNTSLQQYDLLIRLVNSIDSEETKEYSAR